MIREKTNDNETLTNLGGDRLKMEIDMDGLVHICDMLIGQYSDEETSVIREYSNNARDSHIEAGQTRPIEVTLPISAHDIPTANKGRFLRIQDFGIGMSVEDVAETFSRIGKSTKDGSNDATGMMGIGGKSGLVPSFGTFTMTCIKDGQKAVIQVGRDEATEPVMDLASVTETDEPNGVTIELPCERHNRIARKAAALFQFWPEGSVLVDGREPDKLKPKVEITPTIWICEGLRTDFIVMGDVPYPVQLDAKLADDHSLVIFVPIGSLTIAPSREALRMTPKTKDEIARLMAIYDQKVRDAITDAVNTAPTKAEATKALLKARSAFASDADMGIKWRGQSIPLYYERPVVWINGEQKKGILVTKHRAGKLSKHSRESRIFVGTLMDAVLVHGFEGKSFAPVHKKKLEKWAKDKGLTPVHYVLTSDRLAHGWVDSTMRTDWETIRSVKLTDGTGKDGKSFRLRGSWDVFRNGSWEIGIPADDIDTSLPLFYMSKDTWPLSRYGRAKTRKEWMTERYPMATFVEVPDRRMDKFNKDFPMARHTDTIIDEIFEGFVKTVRKDTLLRLHLRDHHDDSSLVKFDESRINDPAIKAAIKLAKRPHNDDFAARLQQMRRLVGSWKMDEHPRFKVEWKNPLDGYPLADVYRLEHTYLYINAVYAAGAQDKS